MVLKSARALPALVLLCLTIFATATFSINHSTSSVVKEFESGLRQNDHSSSIFVGDPVPGGGLPNGANQTLNCTVEQKL
ncbi:MAG: hypothetical protein ABSC91_02315 [Candidatus Bathyarchaeia archaeon]|jgi:hypothetical protein